MREILEVPIVTGWHNLQWRIIFDDDDGILHDLIEIEL
jgi:hypothetical protein